MKLLVWLAAGMVMACITSCASHKPGEATQKVEVGQKIVFLVFQIRADSANSHNSVILLRKSASDGAVKKKEQSGAPHATNMLIIHHFENGELKDSLLLPHPLFAEVEYVNEDKTFAKKMIKKKEAEFFFRLQTGSASANVLIFEQLAGLPRTLLTNIGL
jgi:hypothetical protein